MKFGPQISTESVFALLAIFALGCAGSDDESPATNATTVLAGTTWLVEDISDRGVIDFAQTTIEFHTDGLVSGSTGCNSYNGDVTIDGEELKFGLLAVTMRACPEALMNQERKFLEAVEQVRSYEIAETGLLYLRDEDGGAVMRLSKMEK